MTAESGSWLPIVSAPQVDGATYLVCWAGQPASATFLMWKTNRRIVNAHARGEMLEYAASYFGDTEEWDDYQFAKAENGPTHWLPIPPVPA